jgi:hypothetical protein
MSKNVLVSASVLIALAACNSGGDSPGSGEVTGLQGPEQVTIVESSDGGAPSVRLPRGVRGVAGSHYETDATRFWVRDSSMEALDTVNMILGFLHQTNYWEQTNAGPYRALVEDTTRGDSGGERGQTGPQYEEWVVDSTRSSNSSPQVVKFWIKSEDNGDEGYIYGKLVVEEEPSDAQPLGKLSLNFKMLAASEPATSSNTMFEGYLRTVDRNDGQTEVEFYMGHGDADTTPGVGERVNRERAHVVGDMEAGTGRAYTERVSRENQIQFDADYVARRDVANGNTLSVLDRSDYDTTVFRYGLYDATTEARVEQLSGFPVETSAGAHGWAGFHGIWFPGNVTLTDGMTLLRRNYADNSTTPYTLVKVPGKLERRTRSSLTFADLEDEELQYFDAVEGGEVKATWTGTDFVRLATRSGGEWEAEDPPVSIANSFTTGQWLNMWSQARGQVEFAWPASPSGSTAAFVWSSEVVTADSEEMANGDLTLHGYFRLLQADISESQANFQGGDSPYLPDATSVSSGNQTYVFDRETLMLTLGGNDVNFADGVTVTSGPGQFGLDCGPLFATALTSFNDMASQTTTYRWNIGSNPWNQLLSLQDADEEFVAFTAPLRFSYVHDEDGSPFDGRTFFLEWDGTNLHGIPHAESEADGRWYPQINIPTGATVTSGGTTYKIKQLEGEQQMVEVGDPNTVYAARGFDLDTPLTAPTATPYTDPAIGAVPDVTAPPIYVGGVLQTSDG